MAASSICLILSRFIQWCDSHNNYISQLLFSCTDKETEAQRLGGNLGFLEAEPEIGVLAQWGTGRVLGAAGQWAKQDGAREQRHVQTWSSGRPASAWSLRELCSMPSGRAVPTLSQGSCTFLPHSTLTIGCRLPWVEMGWICDFLGEATPLSLPWREDSSALLAANSQSSWGWVSDQVKGIWLRNKQDLL